MKTELALETRRLSKVYGRRHALRQLDLQVPLGSVFGLLGPNGAGKSTTIRLLLGLIRPTGGEVRLFDESLRRRRLRLLDRVGCLVEGPAFYPYLSGARNLKCLGDIAGGVSWERVQTCLEWVGLADRGPDKYKTYSMGMKQRLGLAGALLRDPELVILDEPLNGLDPPAILLVRKLLRRLNAEGKTLFISSHLLNEVELVCDHVAIIQRGEVVAQGPVDALIKPELTRLDVHTSSPEEAVALLSELEYVDSVEHTEEGALRAHLTEDCPARLNRALVEAGLEISSLTPHQRSLEELFHELAGDVETA